jgi:8-oxo-dGTP diphosphatase
MKELMNEVVVGIVTYHNKVLLVKRVKQEGELLWVFPGGKVNTGECADHAVIREVFEETGVICHAVNIIGERAHPQTNRKIIYFNCAYVSGEVNEKSSSEVSTVNWKSLSEAKSCITSDIFLPVLEFLIKQIGV